MNVEWRDLALSKAEVYYQANFLPSAIADQLFQYCLDALEWRSYSVTVFGKTYPQPRLTAFYGDDNLSYRYSNLTLHAKPWPTALLSLKSDIEKATHHRFNSVLCNLYSHGQDSNGWHSDDERSLGNNPVIASLSLGQERRFSFRARGDATIKHNISLEHGSLLLMKGETQHHWQHQVPKTQRAVEPRINLTFRTII